MLSERTENMLKNNFITIQFNSSPTLFQRWFGFLVALIFLFYTPVKSYAKIEIKTFKSSSLMAWQVQGDVRLRDGNTEILSRKGKIENRFDLPAFIEEFIVVQATLKLEGIQLGERTHESPTLILEINGEKKRRNAHWIRSKGRGWRISTVITRIPPKSNTVTIALRNSAQAGKVIVNRIKVWSANKDELSMFDYPVEWESQINDTAIVPMTLRFASQRFLPLNKKLYGFNSKYSSTKIDVRGLLNHQMVKDVQPFFARFPGGTISNFYHWDCDCLKPEELSQFPNFNKSRWYRHLFKILSKPHSIGQEAVAEWSFENDISLALVVNPLIKASGKELVNFVKLMEEKGSHVKVLELGNELYHEAQRGKSMPEPSDYFNYVRQITPYLKQNLPDLPIGVPFSSENWEWNKSLANAGIDYDGIILHLYAPTTPIASVEEDQYLLEFPQKEIPVLLKKFRQLYPGKSFWITEWGILDRPLFNRNNDHIGILFSANMLLTLMREKDVEAACSHSLFGQNFGLFRFLYDAQLEMFSDDTKISKQYAFWKAMRKIFVKYPETAQIKIDFGNGEFIDPKVNIQMFKNSQERALIIVNNSTKSYKFDSKEFDIMNFSRIVRFTHPNTTQNVDCSINVVPPLSMAIIGTVSSEMGIGIAGKELQ